jgi:hypothetical protein
MFKFWNLALFGHFRWEFISESLRDRGNLLTYKWKLSTQSIQRIKKHIKKDEK